MGSVKNLVPKPPKQDWKKMAEDEKKILRFVCKFVTKVSAHSESTLKMFLTFCQKAEDVDREFNLAFFVADSSISIMEKPMRGFWGYITTRLTECLVA